MKTAKMHRLYCVGLVFLLASVVLPGFGQENDQPDPPSRVARLSYVNGNVSFQPSGEEQWSQATLNYPLTTGDRIFTDRDSRAEIETGNIAIRLAGNTDLTTVTLNDQLIQLGLSQGTLRVRAYDMIEGNSIEIDTPAAALTLLGPGSYRLESYPEDNTTFVTVTSGDLEVSGPNFSETVHSGQAVKLMGDQDNVQMQYVSVPYGDDFDQWSGDRDRRFLSARSREYVGDYVPGYDDLDQYGAWESVPEYGQIWFPSNVSYGWVPYRYGRWVWVEPWGWTWVEDEPWGFAPFHYGRWVMMGARWGWVPGPVVVRPVYAPALVAFVGGGGFSFGVGVQCWFPLGPRDPYFPWYHHSDVYLRQVNVTNVTVRNVTIVNNYINVRNADQVHYAYQRTAATAVPSEAFRTSQPVQRQLVRVNAVQVAQARVIPHPEITPDRRATFADKPVMHPPAPTIAFRPPLNRQVHPSVRAVTPDRGTYGRPGAGPTPTPQGQNQAGRDNRSFGGPGDHRVVQTPQPTPAPGQNQAGQDRTFGGPGDHRTVQAPPPSSTPAVVPDRGTFGHPSAGGPTPTPQPSGQNPGRERTTFDRPPGFSGAQANQGNAAGAQGNAGRGQSNAGGTPPSTQGRPPFVGPPERRPLVTNAPPPPPRPSFAERQPALQQHPGRPLEPAQVNNIRQGQPAGSSHDREYAPHTPPSSGPPPKSNENPHSDDRGRGRGR